MFSETIKILKQSHTESKIEEKPKEKRNS